MKQRIVVITDCKDVAMNELRATLAINLERLNADRKVEIEPIIEAEEFSITNGNFLIRLMANIYNPKITTFLVVINPLKTNRQDRARIIGQTKNGFKFVGENTGTLSWLIKDFGIKEIYESSQKGLDGKEFIPFGGKFIHAPIAAEIASGVPLKKIGNYFDSKKITFIDVQEGTILHIDNFGVAKIFMREINLSEGSIVKILINKKYRLEARFTHSMKNLPDETWAIYQGSSLDGLFELGLVRANGAKKLSFRIGDIVTVGY